MSRIASFFASVVALGVGIVAVFLTNGFSEPPFTHMASATALLTASSTLSVEPATSASSELASTTTQAAPQKPVHATSSAPFVAPKPVAPKTTEKPTAPTAVPTEAAASSSTPRLAPETATSTPPSGNSLLDAAATVLRGALVNIICYAPVGSSLQSISGSGIFIDPKGIILTNAHIGQYFLLADRGVTCSIRGGSPAADEYQASLIYISSAWIHANAAVLTQANPSGTGEYDFALVAVTKSETMKPLPASFPYISLAMVPPNQGTSVVIASFAAQFLDYTQIQSSLWPTVVFGSVKDVYTFGTHTIDILSLGGSAAAQEGSSGGGIADASGTLIGTITTSTVTGATDTRNLSAITASYIRAEYSREMNGDSLDVLLSTPTASSIADFAPQIPLLESIVTANL